MHYYLSPCRRLRSRAFEPLVLWSVSFLIASALGCGDIKLGSSSSEINDGEPDGTVVAQGSFSGRHNHVVTGTAKVYRSTTTGLHILRLEGLTVTDAPSGLQITASANGSSVVQSALKGSSGNQNYNTNVNSASSPTWNSATIQHSLSGTDSEFGIATF